MKKPLVSIIVPTYNSAKFTGECLESIKNQTYPQDKIEIIVVDNNSTDGTKDIARKYTEKVFNKGPERSAQRNYGVKQGIGEYVAIIDSDMRLSERVIEKAVEKIKENGVVGITIPEESFG
jgi:glycosyltransferase involved in cell wall biosynthesis